jgi:hypothetical protein
MVLDMTGPNPNPDHDQIPNSPTNDRQIFTFESVKNLYTEKHLLNFCAKSIPKFCEMILAEDELTTKRAIAIIGIINI